MTHWLAAGLVMTPEMKKCRKMICLSVLALMTGEKVARGGEIVCATLARVREREKEAAAKERNVKDLLQSLSWAARWMGGRRTTMMMIHCPIKTFSGVQFQDLLACKPRSAS